MKIKFKSKSHPLADLIGNEIGEVININTIDGIEHINAIFKDYGGEVADLPLSFFEVVE